METKTILIMGILTMVLVLHAGYYMAVETDSNGRCDTGWECFNDFTIGNISGMECYCEDRMEYCSKLWNTTFDAKVSYWCKKVELIKVEEDGN